MENNYVGILIEKDCDRNMIPVLQSMGNIEMFQNVIIVDNGSVNEKVVQTVATSGLDNIIFDEGSANWGVCANAVISNFSIGEFSVFTDGSVLISREMMSEIKENMCDDTGIVKYEAENKFDIIVVRNSLFEEFGLFDEMIKDANDTVIEFENRDNLKKKYLVKYCNSQNVLTKKVQNLSKQVDQLTEKLNECIGVINKLCVEKKEKDDFESAEYWETRYKTGGNSGAGSYNNLAQFKAEILNDFVSNKGINTIIEWGSGDGNQLSLAKYPQYTGYDVSKTAVEMCRKKYKSDSTKSFVWSGDPNFIYPKDKAELSLSLDVLYHLIEDDIFAKYMKNLFESSNKYVIIYSCNFDKNHDIHVRCRKFTSYVEKCFPEWELVSVIPNKYPYDENNKNHTSWSDFYIYKKKDE